MIKDFFFVLRTLIFTVLIALVLQWRIGDQTLDARFVHWVRTSSVTDYIHDAIHGGTRLMRAGYDQLGHWLGHRSSSAHSN